MKVEDRVMLNSGGPIMRVLDFRNDSNNVICEWYVGQKCCVHFFPMECLIVCNRSLLAAAFDWCLAWRMLFDALVYDFLRGLKYIKELPRRTDV